jgi:hypothetical protein
VTPYSFQTPRTLDRPALVPAFRPRPRWRVAAVRAGWLLAVASASVCFVAALWLVVSAAWVMAGGG